MELSITNNTVMDFDIRRVSSFVHELNITRRHVASYPENHPVIGASVTKVLTILTELLSGGNDVTIGVARNILLVEGSILDRSNPVNRDLANLLFGQGIASISFSRQINPEGLLAFFGLMVLKREQLDEEGGIVRALAKRSISGIRVKPIDYSAFQAIEDDLSDGEKQSEARQKSIYLWENFVRSLLRGDLEQHGQLVDLDPEVLAEFLNRRKKMEIGNEGEDFQKDLLTFKSFIIELGREGRGRMREKLICRLAAFIARLSPELRNQFLNSAFSSLADRPELAESVLSRIPEEAIINALEDMNSRQESLPRMMIGIIGRLSENLGGKVASAAGGDRSGAAKPAEERIRTIFQEDSLDKFLPEAYQKQLHSILTDGLEEFPEEQSEIAEMRDTLSPHPIEERIGTIILHMLDTSAESCDLQLIGRNLVDLCSYFLELGRYKELSNIFMSMREKGGADRERLNREVLAVFAKRDFSEEVLNGLRIWGKNRYPEIGTFIEMVGDPFVEPLLERLAEEQNMSLRRFYMDRLQAIGGTVGSAIMERLRDSRWYYVRNMILLLRNLGVNEAIPQIRRLTGHPHLRVRQEALQALLTFGDAEADRLLLRDLASTDHETICNAVKMAEWSRHPEILKKLVEIMSRKGLSPIECELKSAAIQTLGKIGDISVIPELEKLITSRSLLRASQLKRIKEEAVGSLRFYSGPAAVSLLKTLCNARQPWIRIRAVETLRMIEGGDHAS